MWKKYSSKFRFKVWPSFINVLTQVSTLCAQIKLSRQRVKSLLIDNTVLFHAVTHETAWVATGDKLWGEIPIEKGCLARIPVHSKGCQSREYNSIKYLPAIISLARRRKVQLCLSSELKDEQFTQPVGRFNGYGYFDYSLFRRNDFTLIKDPDYKITLGSELYGIPSVEGQRKTRLDSKTDPLYLALLNALGKSNSQDIWHIVTAEKNGCYCFLTMDYSLLKNLKGQKNNPAVKSLTTKVMTPEEFGREFSMCPISPRLFSYHDASSFVRDDLHQRNSKRQKPGKNT